MKPSSAKAKGRTAQQEVRKLILNQFPELKPDDVKSTSMGAGGEDIQLSPFAREFLPWNIEVKHKKSIAVCRFMEQAATHGEYEPVAIFKENRGPWFACVNLEYLLELVSREGGTDG